MAILAPLVSPSHDRFVTHHPRSGQFNEELTLFVGLTTAGRCALSSSRLDGQDQTPSSIRLLLDGTVRGALGGYCELPDERCGAYRIIGDSTP